MSSSTSEDAPQEELDRLVRVFVSSTFRDMRADRDELMKHVFPQLRKLCESRGVTWGEVDLRWGIPDEEKAEGKVLPICLAEIRGCRPYFLGLLGERYGWVPDEIDQALVEQEPWLEEHREKSVTELEILHGVLNDPAMADHAFFYLREPVYAAADPEFGEGPTEEEIGEFGRDEAERRAHLRREKLAALKERIRQSGLPVRENYGGPKELGELVLADLTAVVDRLYPEGSEPRPLDREAAEHEAFAASRRGVYIGRPAYFEALDAHVASDGPPLVVLGESGSGKSALLANWGLRFRASTDDLVLLHFVGASADSADWAMMLRRILAELERRFGLGLAGLGIPNTPEALREVFANVLHMAAARGRVVVILDGLNQLEDRDGAPDLIWLPPEIPANVRLVLSTLPGRPLEELRQRSWPTVTVEPLEPAERGQLIVDYLAQSRRALSPSHLQRIASAEQTANPLYLRALLDELRVWGEHETIGERIDHYLAAATVDDLYERILERFEEDYERDRPNLVGDAMSLLWAARRGLSEAELLDLLGSDGEPLPSAHWSPLYLAAEQSLVSRSGLIGFFHDYLRQAVEDRFLRDVKERGAAHIRLADYFEARDLGPRQVDELPWQLARAESWTRLYGLLADPTFFQAAWEADEFEVKAYWAQLEERTPLRLVDGYRPVLEAPEEHADAAWDVATLLADAGNPEEALSVRAHLVEHFRESGEQVRLQGALGNQALSLYARGDLEAAMALLEEQERICRETEDEGGLQRALGNKALILQARNDLDGAIALLEEQEQISRALGDTLALHKTLGNRANIAYLRGDLDGAMVLYEEEAKISRELGYQDGLQTSLGNQGVILASKGEGDEAAARFQEKEQICRRLGNKDGLQRVLGYQAGLLAGRGDHEGAMALLDEQERICRELAHPESLAVALSLRAVLLREMNRLPEAVSVAEAAHQLADSSGLILVAQRIERTLDALRSQLAHASTSGDRPTPHPSPSHASAPIEVPTPHPRADPKRASELHRRYLEELAEWEALPWWKRRTVKKPVRPTGI